jgi:CheY-like chemotaxis protein
MHSLFDPLPRRVLVVDDENDVYTLFKMVLRSRDEATDLDALAAKLYGEPLQTESVPRFEWIYANQGHLAVERVKASREDRPSLRCGVCGHAHAARN